MYFHVNEFEVGVNDSIFSGIPPCNQDERFSVYKFIFCINIDFYSNHRHFEDEYTNEGNFSSTKFKRGMLML